MRHEKITYILPDKILHHEVIIQVIDKKDFDTQIKKQRTWNMSEVKFHIIFDKVIHKNARATVLGHRNR